MQNGTRRGHIRTMYTWRSVELRNIGWSEKLWGLHFTGYMFLINRFQQNSVRIHNLTIKYIWIEDQVLYNQCSVLNKSLYEKCKTKIVFKFFKICGRIGAPRWHWGSIGWLVMFPMLRVISFNSKMKILETPIKQLCSFRYFTFNL